MEAESHWRSSGSGDDADMGADEDREHLGPWMDGVFDPLELVCQQLNFKHSLVLDAEELRIRLLTVLDHVAADRVQNADVFERCAASSSGQRARRFRALAAASRIYRDVARRKAARMVALPIDEPRPFWA